MSTTDSAIQGDAATDDGGDLPPADADNPPDEHPVEVLIQDGGPAARGLDVAWVRAKLVAAITQVTAPIDCVTVTVVGDARMRALHEQHRNDATTTDVLTFQHSEPGDPVDADIVVCVDEAQRRATELGHKPERELLLYALHGVLHCAGFDDHDDVAFRSMHAEEDRILTAIGVGPTFTDRRNHR